MAVAIAMLKLACFSDFKSFFKEFYKNRRRFVAYYQVWEIKNEWNFAKFWNRHSQINMYRQPYNFKAQYNWNKLKWHSESADPAKALGPFDIRDRNPVVDISDRWSFLCLCVYTDF